MTSGESVRTDVVRHSPFILILGMHRSGTSCLAGALELCGLHLGDVRRTGVHNAKGYFESRELVQLHEAALQASGGSWASPPEDLALSPTLRLQLARLHSQIAEAQPYGIKDPRTLLLLKEWLEIAPSPPQCVGTFRHPLAVAASLKRRNGMDLDASLQLWAEYNRRLVDHHKAGAFPIICYDLMHPARYRKAVLDVADSLGLQRARWKLWRFVSKRLDHQGSSAHQEIPASCLELFEYLCAHSVNPPLAD